MLVSRMVFLSLELFKPLVCVALVSVMLMAGGCSTSKTERDIRPADNVVVRSSAETEGRKIIANYNRNEFSTGVQQIKLWENDPQNRKNLFADPSVTSHALQMLAHEDERNIHASISKYSSPTSDAIAMHKEIADNPSDYAFVALRNYYLCYLDPKNQRDAGLCKSQADAVSKYVQSKYHRLFYRAR